MNWVQFKVPVCHMCLVGVVVACWSLTQEVAGRQVLNPFTVMTNILSLNSVKTFRKNSDIVKLEQGPLPDYLRAVYLHMIIPYKNLTS